MLSKSQWGPRLWEFLHACSFAFPDTPTEEQTKAFEKLLEALRVLLPCPKCREHYNNFIIEKPAPATCGTDLQKWLVDFHNDVNQRLGKPTVPLETVKAGYTSEAALAKNTPKTSNFWMAIIITIIVIVIAAVCIGLWYWSKSKRLGQVK